MEDNDKWFGVRKERIKWKRELALELIQVMHSLSYIRLGSMCVYMCLGKRIRYEMRRMVYGVTTVANQTMTETYPQRRNCLRVWAKLIAINTWCSCRKWTLFLIVDTVGQQNNLTKRCHLPLTTQTREQKKATAKL